MKWTKRQPRKPGYYWHRNSWRLIDLTVAEIFIHSPSDLVHVRLIGRSGDEYLDSGYRGEWYGPINPPE